MKSMETGRQDGGSDKNHAPFSVGETGNISRKFLTIILKIFDKNFERLQQVMKKAGNTENIKNANMLLSSVLKDGQTIDLVLTYQLRAPIQLPGVFFLQRARVRAWTGRDDGSGGNGGDQKETEQEYVYVTVTGTVCHADPECTHLKLSIREVSKSSLETLRNNSGGKYHPCEKCGDHPGSGIYITNEGNRYHTSLSCSGLKRTVRKVTKEEAGNMRMCSKCGQASP